jgi:hypothetical protein
MSRFARVLFFSCAACAVGASAAGAQPTIFPVQSPPSNERGWVNSPAQVEFLCAQAISCTDTTPVTREGANLVIEGRAEDKAGATAAESITLNIDWTTPLVSIESPIGGATTSRASIAVVAKTSDEVSGPMAATCNGRPAAIGEGGVIRCEVPLAVGANDVVVEVSDRADNSGSAGFRIVRTGTPALTIVPEVIGMIVGQVTTVQVQRESGLPAQRVIWSVDNPAAGTMSSDGRHIFTARAPGTVTVTATSDTARTSAVITIYPGDRLPPGSTRWQVGSLQVTQTPDTQPLQARNHNLVGTRQTPGQLMLVESINNSTGWLNWRERPAANTSEVSAGVRELLVNGGAVVVVDSNDSGRSAIVRTGGTPWRYQSSGQIRPEMVLSSDGGLLVMERNGSGFTQMVLLDASTGRVARREPLPNGTYLALNVRCIKGAHGVDYVPAQVGPLNPQLRETHFGLVLSEDQENFGVCNEVSGTFKRTVMIGRLSGGERRVETVTTIEVPTEATVPEIEVFEVTIDRQGARLLPWATRDPATGVREFRVTRVTDSGTSEHKLAGAGKIWLSGREDDLAVTTDGTHLIGFNVVTGKVIVSSSFEKGVRIMSVDQGQVLYAVERTLSRADLPIQPQH